MTKPQTPPEGSPDTLRLINEEVSDRAARLDANTARLDTKGTALLGFIIAACTFLATQTIGGWWKVLPYVLFVLAAVFGFQSMRPRRFQDAPEPAALQQHVSNRSEAAALALLIAVKTQVFDANHVTHERKATSWRRSLAAFSAAVVLMIGALILGSPTGSSGGINSPPTSSTAPATSLTPAPSSAPAASPPPTRTP